jgi:hypothetical protein
MSAPTQPLRLFLDSGVIIEGCLRPWGASKGLLVLATFRANFTIILAEAVEREVRRAIARKQAALGAAVADIQRDVSGWLGRVRIERQPEPPDDAVRAFLPTVLPALRHLNDLAAVVTAIQARPDWVISTNTAHWNDELAVRTGLRIITPHAFPQRVYPAAP